MNDIDKIRNILNAIFMVGALASFILYWVIGPDKTVFYYVAGASMFFKMVEFALRFLLR